MPEPSPSVADDIVAEHYGARQLGARTASERARDIWSEVDPQSIVGSWARLLPAMLEELSMSQLLIASMSEAYLTALVGSAAAGVVRPSAFAGIASDGRPLASLLSSPAVRALTLIARGVAVNAALDVASRQLGMIVGTQVQDAGRAADGVGIAVRERVGYVRELRVPSCSRCAVLAGKWYRWNDGFLRHPRCDCVHRPSKRSADAPKFDAAAYFASLPESAQNQTFTVAGAVAIRDGADVAQVVNARRGMTAAGTTEGTTRRGLAGQIAAQSGATFSQGGGRYATAGVRLMPEQIYAMASNRAEAVTALRSAGFIA